MFTHYLRDSEDAKRFQRLRQACDRFPKSLLSMQSYLQQTLHLVDTVYLFFALHCLQLRDKQRAAELVVVVLHRQSGNWLYLFRTLCFVTVISYLRTPMSLTAFSYHGVCNTSQNKFMIWPCTTRCNGAENAEIHYFNFYTLEISLFLTLAVFETRNNTLHHNPTFFWYVQYSKTIHGETGTIFRSTTTSLFIGRNVFTA